MEIKKETKESTFLDDLFGIQKEIKNPPKTESGYDDRYRYAPLDMILDMYKPLCFQYNFVLIATIQENKQIVELKHRSGESLRSELEIPNYGTDAQKLGSFLTYARRYLIMNLLNVMGEEDDDGDKTKSSLIPQDTQKNTQKPSPDTSKINGIIYTNRIGTSKSGKPYNAYFPPKGVDAPIYWDKASFDKAVKESEILEKANTINEDFYNSLDN
jgi:hypothetical protein